MKKFSLVFLSLLASLVFAGCLANRQSSINSTDSPNGYSPSTASTPNSGISSGGGGGNKSPITEQISLEQADKSQMPAPAAERKIIRNADLTLETDAPDDVQNKITAIAQNKNGFVIESNKQTSDTRAAKTDTVTMTVRVPAAKFDESLDEIRKTSNCVINETVKGSGVTEEFIDIEARLKTQKALEAQFLEIMKQAKTVEDALNVQSEIGEVRGEIEKIEGRKKFLENQTDFSTLKIRLESPSALTPTSSGFFYQIGEAIRRGFDGAMSFLLVLITLVIALLPLLIFVVLPIYLVVRYFLRKRGKTKLAEEIARAEIGHE